MASKSQDNNQDSSQIQMFDELPEITPNPPLYQEDLDNMDMSSLGINGEIKQMDAIDTMKSLSDNHIDLLLTDIPYGRVNKSSGGLRVLDKKDANDETFDLEVFAIEAFRVTKGNAVIFCGKEQFSILYDYFDSQGAATRMIVWEKTNPAPMNGKHVFLSGVECAVYFKKGGSVFNGNCINTVFRYPSGRSKRHPTEKPLNMFIEFIKILTNPKDLVLDPCMGSVTTVVACEQTRRGYICSDINPEYVSLVIKRLRE